MAVVDRVLRGETAEQGVGHEHRLVHTGLGQQLSEPSGEGVDVEPGKRSRLTRARHVGRNYVIALREARDDRCPVRAGALDASVQENEIWARARLNHGGGHTADVQAPLRNRQPGQHPRPGLIPGDHDCTIGASTA